MSALPGLLRAVTGALRRCDAVQCGDDGAGVGGRSPVGCAARVSRPARPDWPPPSRSVWPPATRPRAPNMVPETTGRSRWMWALMPSSTLCTMRSSPERASSNANFRSDWVVGQCGTAPRRSDTRWRTRHRMSPSAPTPARNERNCFCCNMIARFTTSITHGLGAYMITARSRYESTTWELLGWRIDVVSDTRSG